MQTAPARFNPRKRRRSDQDPSELEGGACQPVSKKPKAVYIADLQQPAAFWDNLSEIPLTRRALRELNRRNTQAARVRKASRPTRRPATRRTVAEWERYHPPLKPPTSFLANRGHNTYSELKSFSKHGGPDLSNLRRVWISNGSSKPVLILLVPEARRSHQRPNGIKPGYFYKYATKPPLG